MISTDTSREPAAGSLGRAPAPARTGTALNLRALHRSFGPVRAVDGIDLAIDRGEVVAFLGPNGAGKTTAIDMVLGLSEPSAGTVHVLGGTPGEAIAAGRVAAVMQTGGLLRDITVHETVELTAALFGQAAPVEPFLRRAGIADIADRRVGKCSGGQQQRLRFAMALVSDPDLLLLDEPTTGMDVAGRRDFWSAIRADAERGRTVVFATHYLEEADAYADRIVLMASGKIVADGTPAEIKNFASGRTVSATLPTEIGAQAVAARLFAELGEKADVARERILVRTKDSDAIARFLLTETSARDVEISAHNLEDAFVALTSGDRPDLAGVAEPTSAPAADVHPEGAVR